MKGIIFDIDGTMLDTEKAVLYSLQRTLRDEGMNYSLEKLHFALGILVWLRYKKLVWKI